VYKSAGSLTDRLFTVDGKGLFDKIMEDECAIASH